MKITEKHKELRKFTLEVDENELGFIWYWDHAATTRGGDAKAAADRLNKLITDIFPEVEYKNIDKCFI